MSSRKKSSSCAVLREYRVARRRMSSVVSWKRPSAVPSFLLACSLSASRRSKASSTPLKRVIISSGSSYARFASFTSAPSFALPDTDSSLSSLTHASGEPSIFPVSLRLHASD